MDLLVALSQGAACSICGATLPAGTQAFWNAERETATCRDCHQFAPGTTFPDEPSLPGPVLGTAGASAKQQSRKLRQRADQKNLDTFGVLGHLINVFRDDTPTTKAYATGARGEEIVARRLNDRAGHDFIVLHDRGIRGSSANIDHIAVARSGVYVIDAKLYKDKKITKRNVGPIFSREPRLFVGASDKTGLVTGLERQLAKVRAALNSRGFREVPLRGFLCFVEADWNPLDPPINFGPIRITSPRRMIKAIGKDSVGEKLLVHSIAEALAEAFPPHK